MCLSVLEKNTQAFREFAQHKGWAITGEREIPCNERKGYISGSSVLLWLKSTGRKLPDYKNLVHAEKEKHLTFQSFLIQPIENKPFNRVTPIESASQPQATGLARVGIDESGKGDYFGPLVIGAVYVDEHTESILIQIGVRDSKRLSDSRILELSEEIKRLCPHSVVHIGPKRYNELYGEIKNLNELLAWGHARALENVLSNTACNLAVADQFGNESFLLNALLKKGRQIKLEQRPKGEQDTAVAAASILARAEFVQSIEQLSRRARKSLPKGSSDPKIITIGREIVKNGGQSALAEVAKLHFKTTQAIIGQRKS